MFETAYKTVIVMININNILCELNVLSFKKLK